MPRGENPEFKANQFGAGINDPSECGKRGEPKAKESYRRNVMMRDTIRLIFELEVPPSKQFKKTLKKMGFPTDEKTTTMFMALFKQMDKAMKGDLDALKFLRDTAGEDPNLLAKMEAAQIGGGAQATGENRIALANLLAAPAPDRDLNALIAETDGDPHAD